MNELAELEALQPLTRKITINNEEIEIKPYKFRQLFSALKHMSNMVADVNTFEDQTVQLFRLLGNHPEDVLGLMSLSTGKPVSFFDDISSEEGIDVVVAVWEVNKDFFVQKIQPKLKSLGLFQDLPEDQTKTEAETAPEPNEMVN